VGQQRNGDSLVHAAYGILDTVESTLEFRRVPYDSERMCRRMRGLRYDEQLIHLLEPATEQNPLWGKNGLWLAWRRMYREQDWGWEPIIPDDQR
jgi:hypothetical protein